MSADSGTTWSKVTTGLPASTSIGRMVLAVAPSNPDIIYAWMGAPDRTSFVGVFGSKNRGTSWAPVAISGLSGAVTTASLLQSDYNICATVDPTTSRRLYLGAVQVGRIDNIDLTLNTGTLVYLGEFTGLSDFLHPHVDQHAFAFGPNPVNGSAPSSLYAANDGGLFRLDSPGLATQVTQWGDVNGDLATMQFYSTVAFPPGSYVGGMQDNSIAQTLGGLVWNGIGSGDGGYSASSQASDSLLFTEVQGLSLVRTINDGPLEDALGSGATGIPVDEIVPGFFTPISLCQNDPARTLALATFRIWETTQDDAKGIAWASSPALIDPNADEITALDYGANNGILYAVTAAGRVFGRTRTGQPLVDVTSNLRINRLSSVAVDRSDLSGNTAYIGAIGFSANGGGHVFKTSNGGQSWTDISATLVNNPVNCLLIDDKGNLFAGNNLGVQALQAGSSTWTGVSTGLPTVEVFSLTIDRANKLLIAGTHGRSAFTSPLP